MRPLLGGQRIEYYSRNLRFDLVDGEMLSALADDGTTEQIPGQFAP